VLAGGVDDDPVAALNPSRTGRHHQAWWRALAPWSPASL